MNHTSSIHQTSDFSSQIIQYLSNNGLKYRISGSYLRFPAIWRGGDGLSVSLHIYSGFWTDFAAGERGKYCDLCNKLGITPSKSTPVLDKKQITTEKRKEEARKQALLDIANKIWNDSKKVTSNSPAFFYLLNRGIPVETIQTLIDTDVIREKQLGKIAILVSRMYEDLTGETFCGIHRIFLNNDGTSREVRGRRKAMLGGSGYTTIQGHGGVEPIIAVGEGLETCLSGWAALDRKPALVVSYVAGNLEKTAIPDDFKSAKILILADRDKPSAVIKDAKGRYTRKPGRGQEAALNLKKALSAQGFTVKMAIPPGIPGHEDKADWNDVYLYSPEETTRLLSQAIEKEDSDQISIFIHAGAEPYIHPYEIGLDEAENELKRLFLKNPNKNSLISVDMSVGKTHILGKYTRYMRETGTIAPSVFVFPTIAHAEDFCRESGAELYRGRSPQHLIQIGEKPQNNPGFCQKHELLNSFGEKHRSLMSHMCRPCPFGLTSWAKMGKVKDEDIEELFDRAFDDFIPGHGRIINGFMNDEARELEIKLYETEDENEKIALKHKLFELLFMGKKVTTEALPFDETDSDEVAFYQKPLVPACSWINQVEEIRHTPFVACTIQSLQGFPDHLLYYKSSHGPRQHRRVFFDDCFTAFDQTSISPEDVQKWVERTQEKVKYNENLLDGLKTITSKKGLKIQGEIEFFKKIEQSLFSLIDILAESAKTPSRRRDLPAPEGFENWTDFSVFINGLDKEKDGYVIEKVIFTEYEQDIPLRALRDLASAVLSGTVFTEKGLIHATFPSLSAKVLEMCMTREEEVEQEPEEDGKSSNSAHVSYQNAKTKTVKDRSYVILDATPTPDIIALVEKTEGSVHEIRVRKDFLRIRQLGTRLHGRSSMRQMKNELHFLTTQLKKAIEKVGKADVCVITHKPLAEKLITTGLLEDDAIGWWGCHERGHNNWKEKKILILFGVPISPEIRTIYEHTYPDAIWTEDREPLRVALPIEIDGRVGEVWSSLPSDINIADFERTYVTASVVQAIGRLRAPRRTEPVEVWIDSSYPLAPVFGLRIDSYESEGGRTMADYQDARWSDTLYRCEYARTQGGDSFRSINTILQNAGKKGISPSSYKKIQEEARLHSVHIDTIDEELLEYDVFNILSSENPRLSSEILSDIERHNPAKIAAALIVREVRREALSHPETLPPTG